MHCWDLSNVNDSCWWRSAKCYLLACLLCCSCLQQSPSLFLPTNAHLVPLLLPLFSLLLYIFFARYTIFYALLFCLFVFNLIIHLLCTGIFVTREGQSVQAMQRHSECLFLALVLLVEGKVVKSNFFFAVFKWPWSSVSMASNENASVGILLGVWNRKIDLNNLFSILKTPIKLVPPKKLHKQNFNIFFLLFSIKFPFLFHLSFPVFLESSSDFFKLFPFFLFRYFATFFEYFLSLLTLSASFSILLISFSAKKFNFTNSNGSGQILRNLHLFNLVASWKWKKKL